MCVCVCMCVRACVCVFVVNYCLPGKCVIEGPYKKMAANLAHI